MIDFEIEGYEINAVRGEHRLGTVYDAVQLSGGREVDLLVLHDALQRVPGFAERFLAAARPALELGADARGVVPVYDAGSHDEALFLARQPLSAGGLDDQMSRRRTSGDGIPIAALPRLVMAVAARLQAMQQRGLVHGNLTPAALRLPADRGLQVTDVGLPVLRMQDVAAIKAHAGEILPFMSPEQMLGREATAASDVFSWGVIAYYLATSRLPRPFSELSRGLKTYWAYTPELLHDLRDDADPHFSAVVHKALSVRPEHRFAGAAEVVAALEALVAPQAGEARDAAPGGSAVPAATAAPSAADGGRKMAVSVYPDRLQVAPGESGTLELTIVNQSAHAQNFTLRVDGVPRQWVSIPQEFVRLVSGAVANVGLIITVPRDSSAEVQHYDLRIEVSSTGQNPETVLVEGSLAVLPFQELAIEMEPQEIRQGQSVTLRLRNTGNEALSLAVSGEDPNNDLRFSGERDDIVVRAGEVQTVAIRVNPREEPLVGRARELPFFIRIAAGDQMQEVLQGRVTVTPAVPTWVAGIVLVALLATCGALGSMLWPQLGADRPLVPGGASTATAAVAVATTTAEPQEGEAIGAAAEATVILETAAAAETSAVASASATVQAAESPATEGDEPTAEPTAEATTPATTEPPAVQPTATPAATATLEPGAEPANEIAVHIEAGGESQIWAVARDGSGQRLLIDSGAQPVWSPDGRRLAFTRPGQSASGGAQRLYVATAGGTELSALNDAGMQIGGLAWSPDGSQIAFHAGPPGPPQETEFEIFVASSDGSGARQVTTSDDGLSDTWPVWSPQGTQILYHSAQPAAGGAQLRLVSPGEATSVPLFEDADFQAFSGEYDWSPGGDRVVFSATEGDDSARLYVATPGEAEPALLPTDGTGVRMPDWSPAGERIAYLADAENGEQTVAIVAAAGGDPQIAAADVPVRQLFWSPAGDEIGIVADFNIDGIYQLFIYAADGSGLVALIDDASTLLGSEGAAADIIAAQWRPHEP